MRVSLIGMSNIGKSTWAKRISADMGCETVDCDALIEEKLAPHLAKEHHHGLSGVAAWMGFPFEPQYKENSGLYMDCEQEVMKETLSNLHKETQAPAVIDTTGSVIYTGADILAELRAKTRVIYFEASDAHIAGLFRRYLAHPKPVIWGDKYAPKEGETSDETLKRCYPELLHDRARRYAEIAHVTISFDQHRHGEADISALIKEQAGAA